LRTTFGEASVLWPDRAEVADIIRDVENWLHEIEPPLLLNVSMPFRLAAYYLIAIVVVLVVVETFRIIIGSLYTLLCVILDGLARYLFFDFAEPIANAYVRMEAMALRLRVFTVTAAHMRLDNAASPTIETLGRYTLAPLPLGVALNSLRVAAAMLLVIAVGFLRGVISIIWLALRPRWRNLTALVLALWYSGLLIPLFRNIGQIQLGDIQLSVIVAAGTLLAVGYAAANSDLRGRAELNKTASVACRTALHGCTKSLLTVATRLTAIREAADNRLARFPTRVELHHLTGRDDLIWLGRSLLPEQAGLLPHRLRKFKVVNDLVGYKTVGDLDAFQRSPPFAERSLLSADDAQHVYDNLVNANTDIHDKLGELRDAGFLGKLDRVLNAPARGILVLLSRRGFGVDAAREIVKPTDDTWLDAFVDDSEELRKEWQALADCEPDDPALRDACLSLAQLLRRLVREEHERYWDAALTEARLRYVAETIDRSLRPRLIERIRQAFGK
jgi:hypothetical protein